MKGPYRPLGQPSTGAEKLLGDLEHEVMEHAWLREQLSVRDVLVVLNAQRPRDRHLAYTTVMTIMARLAEKGLLQRRLVGKAHVYAPALTRDEFVVRSSQEMARRMVADFGEAAIASFLTVLGEVAPDRLARLRERGQRGGA